MSDHGLRAAQDKMRLAGVSAPAIEVFSAYYRQLEAGVTGMIPENTIEPLTEVPRLGDTPVDDGAAQAALDRTVIIKLNGGLGTSMGLDRAKSLLPVREGQTFLDLIAAQVLAARKRYSVRLPLVLMNSFRTQDDTLAALAAHPDLPVDGLPLAFLQNQEPKLRSSDLTPIDWPADPSLEWCPPGHGDLYPALQGSGVLDTLVAHGYRYASVSNCDNLGAFPDARLAGWFAASGAPYAAEVCLRTPNDRKGGHLAVRRSDGQLILRDTAQTPPEDMDYFTDEHRHPFFHTNNLWFDLEVLRHTLVERGSVLGLPMIRNTKHVDPTDASSPEVIQVESAMGAAVEVFEGAVAIAVPRTRFLPVKTTNELLLVRSDAYALDDQARLMATTDHTPAVTLDPSHYRLVADFDQRVPHPPSLSEATSLTVQGDWTFGDRVTVKGDVQLDTETPRTIPDDTVLT